MKPLSRNRRLTAVFGGLTATFAGFSVMQHSRFGSALGFLVGVLCGLTIVFAAKWRSSCS